MDLHLIYLIGVPGSGKSTLMRAVTAPWLDVEIVGTIPAMAYYEGTTLRAVEPGRRRPTFSGTDALGMGVMPKACEWIRSAPAPLVLGEGDRLASHKFWSAAIEGGYGLTVVLLDVPPEVAAERRAERGSTQNETWLRGRETKTANLSERADVRLDATLPTETLVETLRERCPDLAV